MLRYNILSGFRINKMSNIAAPPWQCSRLSLPRFRLHSPCTVDFQKPIHVCSCRIKFWHLKLPNRAIYRVHPVQSTFCQQPRGQLTKQRKW